MYYIATYDVGTTAVKGVLVSSDGEIKTSELVQIKTYFQQDYKEQKPDDWFDAFCQIGKKFTSHVGADKIKAVIMSGQMQDLILVDEAGETTARCNSLFGREGRSGSGKDSGDGNRG